MFFPRNQKIGYFTNLISKNTEHQITKEILEKTDDQIYDSIIINYADGLIDIQKVNSLIKKTIK